MGKAKGNRDQIEVPETPSRIPASAKSDKSGDPVVIRIWPEGTITTAATSTKKKFKAKQGNKITPKSLVVFRNDTDSELRIQVSEPKVFKRVSTGFSLDELAIPPHEESEPLRVTLSPGSAKKKYPYAVFCLGPNEYAQENSMPIIIVDPDD